VGWEKVACWSTKAAISLKCVKIVEKLLWRAYGNLPTLFRLTTCCFEAHFITIIIIIIIIIIQSPIQTVLRKYFKTSR